MCYSMWRWIWLITVLSAVLLGWLYKGVVWSLLVCSSRSLRPFIPPASGEEPCSLIFHWRHHWMGFHVFVLFPFRGAHRQLTACLMRKLALQQSTSLSRFHVVYQGNILSYSAFYFLGITAKCSLLYYYYY